MRIGGTAFILGAARAGSFASPDRVRCLAGLGDDRDGSSGREVARLTGVGRADDIYIRMPIEGAGDWLTLSESA